MRPSGSLINLQPYSKLSSVEVQLDNRRIPAGWASETPEKYGDMTHALRTIAELAEAGLFVPRSELTWHYDLHFDSLEGWAESLERPWCGGSETDAALIDAAGRDRAGRIVLMQDNVAQLFEKS